MKLENIAKIKVGLPLSRKLEKDKLNPSHLYKVFTLKCFDDDTIYPNGAFFEDFNSYEKIDDRYLTKKDDIVIRLREPIKAVYIDKKHCGLLVPSVMAIITPKKEIDSKLLTHYLNSKKIQKELKSKIEGTTIKMVGIKDLKEIDINLPSFNIQKKISTTLELADKEITLLKELINKKKLFKEAILKGLKR